MIIRQRYRPWLLFVSLLPMLAACSDPVPQLRPLGADSLVLAFGDSLTYGTGATPDTSYPGRLGQTLNQPVVNAGVPGEKTAAGLDRLPGLLEEHLPSLVLLCHGGNDLLARLPDAGIKARLAAMVRQARAAGAEVVLIGVPKPQLLLKPAPFYQDLAQELDLPILSSTISEVLQDRKLKADTVHPNAAGYRVIADAVTALLREAGAIPAAN